MGRRAERTIHLELPDRIVQPPMSGRAVSCKSHSCHSNHANADIWPAGEDMLPDIAHRPNDEAPSGIGDRCLIRVQAAAPGRRAVAHPIEKKL